MPKAAGQTHILRIPARPGLRFAGASGSAHGGFAERPNRALGPISFGTSQDQFTAS